MHRPATLLLLGMLAVGCTNTEPTPSTTTPAPEKDMQTTDVPDTGDGVTDMGGGEQDMASEKDPDAGMPQDMREEELRPNVQADQQANAQNQTPGGAATEPYRARRCSTGSCPSSM